MAVTSTTPSVQFTANGSTTEFAFTFVVPASDSGGTITTSTGSISSGDQTLTVTAADFFYTSDLVGKAITVAGAGSGSATLSTTILSRTSGTVVELTDAASTTVSGQNVVVTTGAYATTLNTNSDIKVFVDGVAKTIGESNDYTVLLNVGDDSNKAGKVIFNSAPSNNSIVTIQRDVTLARTTDFQTGGALTAKTLNSEFDTMIMAIQDTQFDTTAGAVKFPEDETPTSSYLPVKATRASKVLAFDSSGEFSMKTDLTAGTSAITGTIVKGTTSLQTPLIEYTDGDDAITIADGGAVTIANLTASSVNIDGGAIDGTAIGANSHSTGKFTTLQTTGATTLQGLTYPSSDGSADFVLKTDGSGNLSFGAVAGLSLFTALTDTPSDLSGQGGKYVRVNSGGTALEFDTFTSDDAAQGSNNIYFSTSGAAVNTTNLAEGTNLYFTNARADARITNAILDEDNFASDSATKVPTQQSVKAYIATQIATKDNSDEITEGSTNLYFTNARARSAVSVTDSGGDGSLAYNSSTGVITYTGPSASEVRAHITAGEGIDISSGAISGEDATASNKGIASFSSDHFSVSSGAVSLAADGINDTHLDFGTGTNQISTDDIPEGSNKKFFTTNGGAINTDSLPEGSTNLYFTNARAQAQAQAVSINNVSEDSTPQLGGNLDVNNQDIISGITNGAVEIKPNGTGAFNVETQGNIEIKAGVGTLQGNGWQWLSDDTMKILQYTAPDSSNSQRFNIASGDYGVGYAPLHLQGGMSIGGGTSATTDLLFNTGIQIEADTKGFPAVVMKTKSSGNQDSGNDRFGNIWFARSGSDSGDAYVTENATIGGFYCSPYDADDGDYYNVTAKFLATATEDHSDGAMGTMMQWFVTKDGSKSLKEALRMKGNRVEVNPGNNNIDFRVDGDTNDGVLFVDAGTERVGVKTTSPSVDLDVAGSFKATSFDSSVILSHLGDVAYPSAPDGTNCYLKYNTSTSKFEPSTLSLTSNTLGSNLELNGNAIRGTFNASTDSGQGATGIILNSGYNGALGGIYNPSTPIHPGGQASWTTNGIEYILDSQASNGGGDEVESSVHIGKPPLNSDFAVAGENNYGTYGGSVAFSYPTLMFRPDKMVNKTFGGMVSTMMSGNSTVLSQMNHDLVLGAFPVAEGLEGNLTKFTDAEPGAVRIFAGFRTNDAKTQGTNNPSVGGDAWENHIWFQYDETEIVKFEHPTTGTASQTTITASGNASLAAGDLVFQANSNAKGYSVNTTTNSNQIVLAGVIGTFTTNSSDTLSKHNTTNGTDGLGVYPSSIGSATAGITSQGARATFLEPLVLANKTTTERNALTGTKGMTIFNSTLNRIEYHDGSGWKYVSGTSV